MAELERIAVGNSVFAVNPRHIVHWSYFPAGPHHASPSLTILFVNGAPMTFNADELGPILQWLTARSDEWTPPTPMAT